MQSGKLDQRVTIEKYSYTTGPIGQVIVTWTPLAEVWAAVEPLNGREFYAAAMTVAQVETRIRIRYRADLSVTDRIRHGDTLHDIQSIINPRSGDRELVLMCKAFAA